MKGMKRFIAIMLTAMLLITVLSATAFAGSTYTTTGSCNMRTGPGLDYDVILSMKKGIKLTSSDAATDERGVKWIKTSYNGKTGWVSTNNLSGNGSTGGGGGATGMYVVITGSCNVRSTPSLDGAKLGSLGEGKSFSHLDTSTDSRGVKWYKIKYNGSYGWVSSKYSKLSGKGGTGGGSTGNTVVITGTCNVRKSPNLDGKIIGGLTAGASFKLYDTSTDGRGVKWFKIKYDGNYGWVSSKYSKLSGSKPSPTKKPIDYSKFVNAGYYVSVTASSLNLRYEPSTDSTVLAAYSTGDVLYAVRTNGSWYEVVDETTNKRGYVSAKYAERISSNNTTSFSNEINFEEAVETNDGTEYSTFAELQAAAPSIAMKDAPEGSTDVTYTLETFGEDAIPVAVVSFVDQGVAYELRMAAFGSFDQVVNIDDITLVLEFEQPDLHLVNSADGEYTVAHWYDMLKGTWYSLCGPAAMNGLLVQTVAQSLAA